MRTCCSLLILSYFLDLGSGTSCMSTTNVELDREVHKALFPESLLNFPSASLLLQFPLFRPLDYPFQAYFCSPTLQFFCFPLHPDFLIFCLFPIVEFTGCRPILLHRSITSFPSNSPLVLPFSVQCKDISFCLWISSSCLLWRSVKTTPKVFRCQKLSTSII